MDFAYLFSGLTTSIKTTLMAAPENTGDFIFYSGNDGKIKAQVIVGDETVWTSQKGIAEIFSVDRSVITKHIRNIFNDGELLEGSNVQKMHITNSDKPVSFYNLDVIISVGYRVNSYQATQFRIWATKVLKEYMIKGFALDDERLKQGEQLFGKDYFVELLERIREIRASERRFYQKITDIYTTSLDYDKCSPISRDFFATVQNKLHFAITGKTASEIIHSRADSNKPHMGLTTWKGAPDGKIHKTDVAIAKNYMTEDEIGELNIVVNMYLDYAELQAKRKIAMKMKDWVTKLDAFLGFNAYEILGNGGKISKEVAKQLAEGEYDKFRVTQDKEYLSDFDKILKEFQDKGKIWTTVTVSFNPSLVSYSLFHLSYLLKRSP